jgi:hypothetical protein
MAVLTTTITEEVYLNGANRGSINTYSVTGINDVMHRIVEVPTNLVGYYTELISFDSYPGGSVFNPNALKYLRVTNVDKAATPTSINLKVQTANNEHIVVLGVNESYILFKDNIYAGTGVDQAFTLADIKTVKAAAASTFNCPVEIFVASV